MQKNQRFTVLILLVYFVLIPVVVMSQYTFNRFNYAQGLSQSSVKVIFQDRMGFLWFGTIDGLNRYDGYQFQVFRHQLNQPNSISGNEIRSIHEDLQGNIWIGTKSNGICYFDKNTESFVSLTSSEQGEDLSDYDVSSITNTPDGTIWFGTTQAGLFYINPITKKIKKFALQSKTTFGVSALKCDWAGNLWIGTIYGNVIIKHTKSKALSIYSLPINSKVAHHKSIVDIHEDAQKNIRFGTYGGGLYRWNPLQKKFETELFYPNEFEKRNVIWGITQDQNKNIWLACDDGLMIAKNGDFSNVQHIKPNPKKSGGFSTHALQSILCDSFGNIWIGSWETGLYVYYTQKSQFEYLQQSDGLLSDKVTGIIANEQDIIISTDKGITLYNRKSKTFKQYAVGDDITSMNHQNGNIVSVVWNTGSNFYKYSKGKLEAVGKITEKENTYREYLFKRNGGLIIGSSEGKLFNYNFQKKQIEDIRAINHDASLGLATVLYEAKNGLIYIGSYNRGLWVYDPQSQVLQFLGDKKTIGNSQIICIYEDIHQQLWIGTNGKGLIKYHQESNQFESLTTESGLPNNVVKSIIDDAHNNLWIATNEGLCKYNPEKKTWKIYADKNGINGKEFMPRAVTKDPKGYLFFGGIHGLNYFHPDSISDDKRTPLVYITGLKLLNKTVKLNSKDSPLSKTLRFTDKINLSNSQANSITFDYVGLYFQKNAECKYRYILEGFNEDWNYVGTQRNATYTNLAPGTYLFRVEAANPDGIWNQKDAHIQLVILPPWYQTWWAYCIYILLGLMLMWVYRWFVRKQEKLESDLRLKQIEAEQARELEKMKSNFFTNISHEFKTPLTLIIDPIEQLINKELPNIRIEESYQVIHRNGQRLLNLVNELLDLSKIEAEKYTLHLHHADIIEFISQIVYSFHFQANKKGVAIHFHTSETNIIADFSVDALEKILFNLISNAIKASSQGGKIDIFADIIKIQEKPHKLRLVVQDTGIGIAAHELDAIFTRFFQGTNQNTVHTLGTGIGLALTAELVKIHKGNISVESKENLGTIFKVEITIDANEFPEEWLSIKEQNLFDFPEFDTDNELDNNKIVPLHNDNRKMVLIVEDNEELRHYLKEQLSTDFNVLVAENGNIGYDLAVKFLPDLVVSDVVMPEIDGFELCRKLKLDEKTSHIPIILLTSKSSVESQLKGLKIGADDYQMKPFKFQLLHARINNLIKQRQILREKFSRETLIEPSLVTVNETDANFLKKVITIIENNMNHADFDVVKLEKSLNMSQMQLYRKLTSLTSMSGNVFIRHIRLHRAKQLLMESNLTIAEIAYQVGFNSPSYFTRAYKKEFGVLPSKEIV